MTDRKRGKREMRMLLAPVVAAIPVVSVRAAEPFPAGYTLNNGRRIAFKQALPRQRNAETGLNCDWYNTKNLAIPGVATGTDPSLSAFMHLFYRDESGSCMLLELMSQGTCPLDSCIRIPLLI